MALLVTIVMDIERASSSLRYCTGEQIIKSIPFRYSIRRGIPHVGQIDQIDHGLDPILP